MAKIIGIYKIENTLTKDCYVGSSVNIKNRWSRHTKDLKNNKHHCRYLARAVSKYGFENFKFEILLELADHSNLLKWEQIWMDALKPVYNTAPIAGSNIGVKHSQETCEKLSKRMRGRPKSPEHIEQMRQRMIGNKYTKGVPMPAHVRDILTKACTGRKISEKMHQECHVKRRKPLVGTNDAGEKIYVESILAARKAGFISICKSLKLGRKCKGYRFKYALQSDSMDVEREQNDTADEKL